MTETLSPDTIRERVSTTYGQRIEQQESCCGPSCCGPSPGSSAGTSAEAKGPVSFGCGDPLAFSEVLPGQTVVDLGSGAGFDLLLAAERVGPEGRVIGVDMTPAMIDEARRQIARSGHDQIEVREGLIEEMPLEDAAADWVISNCVINLSPEKPRVFAEIARVLRPGGRLSVTDIVSEDLPAELLTSGPLYDSCVAGAITEAEYVAGLEAAGLTDVKAEEVVTYDGPLLRGLAEELGFSRAMVASWLPRLEGKIRSLRFTARKPS